MCLIFVDGRRAAARRGDAQRHPHPAALVHRVRPVHAGRLLLHGRRDDAARTTATSAWTCSTSASRRAAGPRWTWSPSAACCSTSASCCSARSRSLNYAIETGERRFSMWNPSMIPIKALMVACLVLMLLQSVSLVFKHIASAARSRPCMSYELIAILMFAIDDGAAADRAAGVRGHRLRRGRRGAAALGQGAVEMPFNAAFKLFNWFPMLTLPLFIYMGYVLAESGIAEDLYRMLHVWFGPGARRAGHRHDLPDGDHLGDERPVGRGHGDRRHHRAARAAAARLRQGDDHRRRAGRLLARHPDPAQRRAGALRHDRAPAGRPALAGRHRSRPADGGACSSSTS